MTPSKVCVHIHIDHVYINLKHITIIYPRVITKYITLLIFRICDLSERCFFRMHQGVSFPTTPLISSLRCHGQSHHVRNPPALGGWSVEPFNVRLFFQWIACRHMQCISYICICICIHIHIQVGVAPSIMDRFRLVTFQVHCYMPSRWLMYH